jgi:hypothetical protein
MVGDEGLVSFFVGPVGHSRLPFSFQQLWQLGDTGCNLPSLILGHEIGRSASAGFRVEVHIRKGKVVGVAALIPRYSSAVKGQGNVETSFRYDRRTNQESYFPPEPFADNTGALFAIGWPRLWEDIVRNVIRLDAEGIPDHLSGIIRIVAVDRAFQNVGHNAPHTFPGPQGKQIGGGRVESAP